MFRQRIVSLIEIGLVFLVCALAYVYGPSFAPRPDVVDTAGRLAFAVEWLAVPAVTLLAFVVLTSLSRFFDDDAFGGTLSRSPAASICGSRATKIPSSFGD